MPGSLTTVLTDDDVLSKDKINNYILTPISDLVNPPADGTRISTGSPNYTTASTTFTAVDDTLGVFYKSVTTKGNPVMVLGKMLVSNSGAGGATYINFEIDGSLFNVNNNGVALFVSGAAAELGSIFFIEIVDLAAGAHDFKLRWRAGSGTSTLYTATQPTFYIREL